MPSESSESDDAYVRPGLLSRFFFFYVTPVIKLGAQRPLESSDMPPLAPFLRAANASDLYQRELQKGPSPLRAFVRTFAWPFMAAGALRAIRQGVQIVNAVLFVPMLIDYIRTPADQRDHLTILGLVAYISLSLFVQTIMHTQHFIQCGYLGMQFRGAYVDVVFQKMLKLRAQGIPSGVIVNMISNDSSRLTESAFYLHNLTVSPFECLAIIALLLWKLGVSAIPGVVIIVGFFPIQGVLGQFISKMRHRAVAKTDARVRVMTDILQAMKLVKLYSWQKPMADIVRSSRLLEMAQLRSIAVIKVINLTGGISTPMLASIASFCMFVALGNQLDPDIVFSALGLFNMLRLPLSSFPQGVKSATDVLVAMKRLRALLLLPELDLSATHTNTGEQGIALDGATFAWKDTTDFSTLNVAKPSSASAVLASFVSAIRRAWSTGRAGFQRLSNSVDLADTDDAEDGPDAQPTTKTTAATTEGTPEAKSAPFSLKNIGFKAGPGELVAVVGSVGAGKSSLLSALLGEMAMSDGTMLVNGRIGYVPQQAWIINATLRENILFGNPFDEGRYSTVVAACCLEHDIASLPGGDLTEIGERGVNLSGGQRHRVALARAVYLKETSILLLDDPFHAVDAIVGRRLMDQCINDLLLREGKTVVLVTHQLPLLKHVANLREVIVLNEGAIVKRGADLYANTSETIEAAMNEPASTAAAAAPNDEKVFKMVKAEDRSTGKVSFSVFLTYLKSAGGYLYVGFILALYVISQGVRMAVDWWLAEWVDAEDLLETADYNPTFYMGVYFGLGFGFVFLLLISRFLYYRATLTASTTIHSSVFEAVLGAPMSFFDTTPVGRLVNRFSGDIDQIDDSIPDTLEQTLFYTLQVLGILMLVVASLWQMLFVYLPLSLIFVYYTRAFRPISRELKRLESIARSPLITHIGTTLFGLSLVRSFGAQQTFREVTFKCIDSHHKLQVISFASSRWLSMRLDIVSVIITIVTSILLLIVPIDAALAGFVLSYVLQLTQIFQFCTRQLIDTETKMTTVERLTYYVDTLVPEEINTDPMVPVPQWPAQGELSFNSVSMRYRAELPLVLENISFSVPAGAKIGIVGRTGSGKSSLAVALFRLAEIEAGGSIVLDGVNTGELLLDRLRKTIATIPQEPVLFEGTVRSNLDPFNAHSDGDVWRALEQSHMSNAIKRLDDGLLAVVTDHGDNFSVGERQLLCLARAALRQPKVLLLDEATAAVDSQTDALVQKTIREAFADCTVLTIAHRLDTIIDADRVLVMSDGHVNEYDEPAVLLGLLEPVVQSPTTGPVSDSIFAQLVAGTGESNDQALRKLALEHALRRRSKK